MSNRKLLSTKRIDSYVVRAYFTEMPLDLSETAHGGSDGDLPQVEDEQVIPAIGEIIGDRMLVVDV